MDTSDALIIILFTLFTASMVNERIIDFLKLHFPTLWLKSFDLSDELARYRRLWLLAFGMGLFSATVLDINLVQMLSENPDALGNLKGLTDWFDGEKTDDSPNFAYLLGLFVTALFISLGSKFWHDLLDLVLFVKNSQRKKDNFNPEGITNIETIEKYQKEDDYAIAQKALQANLNELQQEFPDASFNVGYEFIKGVFRLCVVVLRRKAQPATPEADGAPPSPSGGWFSNGKFSRISHRTNYGYVFHFPVLVYYPGEASIADGQIAVAGGGLFNADTSDNVGTFGCIVKDQKAGCKDYFLLTCYHCVRVPGTHAWTQFDEKSPKNEVKYVGLNPEPFLVGKIKAAYRDSRMDVAIIQPEDKEGIADFRFFNNQSVPSGSRRVDEKDAQKRTKIWFSGKKSGNSKGYIINFGCSEGINYKDGEPLHELNNLIIFSKNSSFPYQSPCRGGDSGSIIIDADTNLALGMIVASDSKFGYAIPIHDILLLNGLALMSDPCEITTTHS